LEKESFDLVFMDVQMPEMDALEATMALRERENSSGAHHLVIALTAHAMKGDEERCRHAASQLITLRPARRESPLLRCNG
jgi:two-component system, sensor histidine kinase and response regulator